MQTRGGVHRSPQFCTAAAPAASSSSAASSSAAPLSPRPTLEAEAFTPRKDGTKEATIRVTPDQSGSGFDFGGSRFDASPPRRGSHRRRGQCGQRPSAPASLLDGRAPRRGLRGGCRGCVAICPGLSKLRDVYSGSVEVAWRSVRICRICVAICPDLEAK
eukprot:gene205-biopygen13